jgi:hypothetical protein
MQPLEGSKIDVGRPSPMSQIATIVENLTCDSFDDGSNNGKCSDPLIGTRQPENTRGRANFNS